MLEQAIRRKSESDQDVVFFEGVSQPSAKKKKVTSQKQEPSGLLARLTTQKKYEYGSLNKWFCYFDIINIPNFLSLNV